MSRVRRLFSVALCLVALPFLSVAQDFSPDRLKAHVNYLCDPSLKGRKAGSPGELEAARYLYDQLSACGVEMLSDRDGQEFTIASSDTVVSRNIVGVVEGCDSALRNEYIVIGCHLDAPGTTSVNVDGRSAEIIFPGADDDASGVAVMIETAREVAMNSFLFARTVVFIGFGASEEGMAGAWYFINRTFAPWGNVRMMIDLDMVGRGGEANPLTIHTSLSHADLQSITGAVSSLEPILPQPVTGSGEMTASDYLPFHERGIPFLLLTTGMTREYHTVRDTPSLVLYRQMSSASAYAYYLLEHLCEVGKVPGIAPEPAAAASSSGGRNTVYNVAQCTRAPKFFNGEVSKFLTEWVYRYQRYPKKAVEEGIQGKVVVSFIVEADGNVTEVEVVSSPHVLLEEEAVRIVRASPKWTPGEVDGRKVRTKISIPVEFRLK